MSAKGYSGVSVRPIPDGIVKIINDYGTNPLKASSLVTWVKLTSGAGLTIVSNPDIPTFGVKSIHGDFNVMGSVGISGFGESQDSFDGISGVGYRPRPIIESVNIKNGKRGLSKKATIKIKCFTTQQLEEIAKYFNEPGFTLAVEWGWNTDESLSQIRKSAAGLASINNLDERESSASKSKYQYDNFLGNITGGSISVSDDAFELSIEATGLGDLALNLEMNQQITCNKDNTGDDSTKSESISSFIKSQAVGLKKFLVQQWSSLNNIWEKQQEKDPNKMPFLEMYQNLPAEYQTQEIKNLSSDPDVGPHYHYVGFNKEVRDSLFTKGWLGLGGLIKSLTGWNTSEPSMNKVDLEGESMVDEERFIRFGTLIKILNTANRLDTETGIKTPDGKSIKLEVNTKNVPISAHRRIFSTNKSRLIILNNNTPDFGLVDTFTIPNRNDASIYVFLKNQDPMTTVTKDVPTVNTLYTEQIDPNVGVFPQLTSLSEGIYDAIATTWGYLEDLYINFDFAVSIIKETGKLKKDAILDMINGMSSAVNNLWDFQYVEEKADDSTSILTVVDMNFSGFKDEVKFPKFVHWGANSPFKNFSLDIDIPSAMKNQIIAKRLTGGSLKVNQSMPNAHPALWSQGNLEDQILLSMPVKSEDPCKEPAEIKPKPTDKDILNKQSQEFVKKAGIFIKENNPENIPNDLMDLVNKGSLYVGIYNDTNILEHVKIHDLQYTIGDSNEKKPGVLLPVTVTFTIIGMSGIQFGHSFIVADIFKKFAEGGVFQVREIEHTINGNIWETTVEAQFRPMVLG
jgi:hypothetical protein